MLIRWIALDRLKQADQSDTLVTSGSPNINNHGADERHLSLNLNKSDVCYSTDCYSICSNSALSIFSHLMKLHKYHSKT